MITVIQIDNILVSSEIITEYFDCDYSKCEGKCCIVGDSGAPLNEEEVSEIEKHYRNYIPYMTPQGREVIGREGFFTIDIDGDMVTPLVGNGGECAYTCFDEHNHCYCAMEKAHLAGTSSFHKPISCYLYPIRVTHLSSGMTALNLHRWYLCQDAFLKGKKEKIRVYQFLKEPLIRAFGEEFYKGLEVASKRALAVT